MRRAAKQNKQKKGTSNGDTAVQQVGHGQQVRDSDKRGNGAPWQNNKAYKGGRLCVHVFQNEFVEEGERSVFGVHF